MIARPGPYAAYRDSGVPWLGEVPEHWEVLRLRNVAAMLVSNVDKLTKDGEEPIRLCNYVDVYKNERIRTPLPFMKATASFDEVKRFHLEVGDVLITKDSESWTDIGVPALVEETASDLICGYHLAILRPFRARTSGGYLLRALQAPAAQYQFHVQANGVTRYGLSHDAIKAAWIPLPPRDEQVSIERFLDHADRQVRRYIRAKQKLIKLLEGQKQAIIYRAVTGGLDPRVRFKPSGVDWVGDMPAHWQVWQMGFLARIGNGSTPSRSNSAYWSGGTYPWLNSSHVNQSSITAADQFVTEAALRECHLPIVSPESVLIGITGQGKTRGKAAVLRFEATINQHIAFATPKLGVVGADYLRMALEGAYAQLRSISEDAGSTKGALTCEDLKHFRVPIPPLAEQQRILHAVSRELATTSAAINQETRAIDLLREFRTRLIADVVTGKADVREAAARLPAEIDEAETVDGVDAFDDTEADTDADLDAETEEVGV